MKFIIHIKELTQLLTGSILDVDLLPAFTNKE